MSLGRNLVDLGLTIRFIGRRRKEIPTKCGILKRKSRRMFGEDFVVIRYES